MDAAPYIKMVLWRRDRMFYTGFALSAIAVVFAAFGRTYYLKSYTGAPPLPALVHLHAVYDRIVRGRIHRAYIWGIASIAISFPLRTLLARTETWQDFAEWMIQ
jgi:hypothetical protein